MARGVLYPVVTPEDAMPKDFATIDPAALDAVTGGRRTGSSSSRSSIDDRLMDKLDDIQNALRDLGKQQQGSSSGLDQLLPLLAMSLLNRGNGPGYGGGNGCGGGRY